MAKIYVKFNSAVIKEVEITKDEITFGRKAGNDVIIDHPTVSGSHCKIKKEGDHFIVEDLKSTNGTFINGQRITTSRLKNKDQIKIASHVLEFFTDNGPTPAEPAPDASAGGGANGGASAKANAAPSQGELPDVGGEAKQELNGKPLSGVIRIVSGGVNQTEIKLKELVTYIGTSDQAAIKIKGFLAPSLAAAISHRPEGYFLKAIKAGYPKVNGHAINEQILLENGSMIEVGGTNMVFYVGDANKGGEAHEAA